MKKQYLHLSAFSCAKCNGPVISASLAVRENAISKETGVRRFAAVCLACGHGPDRVADQPHHFPPVEWHPADEMSEDTLATSSHSVG
jgi:hypothetical protein